MTTRTNIGPDPVPILRTATGNLLMARTVRNRTVIWVATRTGCCSNEWPTHRAPIANGKPKPFLTDQRCTFCGGFYGPPAVQAQDCTPDEIDELAESLALEWEDNQ